MMTGSTALRRAPVCAGWVSGSPAFLRAVGLRKQAASVAEEKTAADVDAPSGDRDDAEGAATGRDPDRRRVPDDESPTIVTLHVSQ